MGKVKKRINRKYIPSTSKCSEELCVYGIVFFIVKLIQFLQSAKENDGGLLCV